MSDFLTNIANAIRTKKGTTAQINAQDFASEIESIEGGESSGGATLKGGWTGTAVPVDATTTIENIYLNKQLSNEEIVNLIETNISLSPIYSAEEPKGFICVTATGGVALTIIAMNGIGAIVDYNIPYFYFAYDTTGAGHDIDEVGFSGWNPDFDGVIMINETQSSMVSQYLSARLNEAIKSLISTTPFEKINIELSGTYEDKELVITENGTIDLLNDIKNNKKIITKLNINTPVPDQFQQKLHYTQSAKYLFTNWSGPIESFEKIATDLNYGGVTDFTYTFSNTPLVDFVFDSQEYHSVTMPSVFENCSNLINLELT